MRAKILTFSIVLMFAIWLIVLPFRSIMYVARIYSEFRIGHKVFKPNVDPCSALPANFNNFEDKRLFNYRRIGVKCEK